MTIQAESKPMETKKGKTEKKKPFPSDRKILDTLYAHYGHPKNIVKEKVTLYLQYTSPAGMSMGAWTVGDYQIGRVTVFTGYRENKDDLYAKTKIEDSWFIGVKDDQIKIWTGGVIDNILTIT
tara:strand:- start:8691 stop:9059 length:369 start_codon:yes stop_codon:yes gene_type:complete